MTFRMLRWLWLTFVYFNYIQIFYYISTRAAAVSFCVGMNGSPESVSAAMDGI